jgi:CTP synthase (UTP-ammonia lyase)
MQRIALIGDYSENVVAHRAIPIALQMAASSLKLNINWDWIHSISLTSPVDTQLDQYDGIWCVPGSPYQNTRGIIEGIRYARTHLIPFLGTCGGFQHAVMEYAEAVWGVEAFHAETDPEAVNPVIAPLMCSLVNVADQLHFEPGSKLRAIYGKESAHEEYQCRFGLNPMYVDQFNTGKMKVAARDDEGSIRAIELDNHPFFIGALFQPERAALKGQLPPVVKAFVECMLQALQAR